MTTTLYDRGSTHTDLSVIGCAGYIGYPFKKTERPVPKLSASLLALPSQGDACAKKLRIGKPLLNEHASRYLDNQIKD
jgi:hypothetical protein